MSRMVFESKGVKVWHGWWRLRRCWHRVTTSSLSGPGVHRIETCRRTGYFHWEDLT